MKIPDQLELVFAGEVEQSESWSYQIEVPASEVGTLIEPGEVYRVAVLPAPETDSSADDGASRSRGPPEPPVEEGETREVQIESIGDQGDGIARVERGFVVVVPDTSVGETVRVEITDVKTNVAFAEVQSRLG